MGSRSPRRPTAAGRLFGGGGPRVEDEELLRHQARSTSNGALARAHGGGSGGGGSHPQPPQASRKAADSYAEMGSPALLQNQRLMAGESASDDPAVRSGKRALTGGGPGPGGGGGGGKQQPGGGGGKKPPAPDDSMAATTSADAELREVYFNYAPGNAVFDRATNVVVTSKYNVVTFLPKFLKESFSKVANFFFLVVCVLQSIKSISNTYGVPTNSPVLLFVISIDAVFAIMEDLRRHQADNEANAAKCHIVRNGRVEDARCVLVNPQELLQLRGVVKCETPNPYINKFAGKVEVAVGEGCGVEVMPLSAKNVLLRGCNLRNTDWVLGLVLNTGPDTKIMQSSVDAPSNDDVRAQPRWQAFVQMLFYYFLLLYQVIPISLYVSMTSVKFLQAKFMIGRAALVRAGKPVPPEPTPEPGATPMQYVNFVDPAFFAAMKGGAGAAQQAHILRFFEHLAVCHTVIPETLETGEVRLSASSPDEQALVAGAAFAGFRFLNRGVGKATIEVFGERQPLKHTTREHMEKFADDGLRTLALAVKRLDEKWFLKWKRAFDEAQGSVVVNCTTCPSEEAIVARLNAAGREYRERRKADPQLEIALGPERYYFNLYTFFRWVGAALFESLVIFVVMSFGFNASESAPGSESRVEYGMVAFSMTVLIVNLKIWLISDTWTLLALTCWSLSVLSWFGFAALGTQVPFFARLKVSYDEYGAFAPTAWSWGYVLVVLIGCVIALGRHFAYNQYQRTFYPELNQVLSESVEKRQRRLTINHVEEQTLSMSLDDVTSHHHLHHYLSRGSADATATSYQTNSSGLQGNHGDKCDNGDTTTSNSGGGGRSNSGGELDSGVRRPAVRSTVSESVPLTADSFSASVYSASVSEEDEDDGVGAWDRIPPKYLKTTSSSSSGASRRNTGFAFSCDEETTLAESYIASNSLPRSDAVPAALRNSMISRRPSR
ncbi:hypothetical protein PybrP1_000880 [[Pythium] brassicae (nom. inval.)]|nr:hypothetical protein PybrP1_000880 [[Pythium] brassicae (nom. inval.)]